MLVHKQKEYNSNYDGRFISNSGKVLIRAADIGRLSRTGTQTETKANWQYLRQQIPADC